MCRSPLVALLAISLLGVTISSGFAAEPSGGDESVRSAGDAGCLALTEFKEVWIKVGQRVCVKCHQAGEAAAESDFVLVDDFRLPAGERAARLAENFATIRRLALRRIESGESMLLAKARGGLEHGGGEVLTEGSAEWPLLRDYVAEVVRDAERSSTLSIAEHDFDEELGSFFDGVRMISDQRLLRRVTLSLAGRLPTDAEQSAVRQQGLAAFDPLMAALMREEAFYERLLEGFNDIFLTLGFSGNGVDVLSYNHFEKSRLWYQKHSLDHVPEPDRQKARYRLADQYYESLRREPLELLRYIVREDRPFTEILTADYTMVSPYSARGYGVFESLRDQFLDPDDPFEYIPTRIPALTARDGKVQPTEDGWYPHSGLLTMFQYLRRYPTTETNRNRLRARMYYQHFLGVDVMSVAPRVSDAAAIEAQYQIPTMEAAACVVCHRTIDPVAGLFQDYYNEEGHYGPRKDGWFVDMFPPGREGTGLPESERLRPLRWLAEQTVADPRFAIAMAEHVHSILTGRKTLPPPADIEDPHFAERRRAYLAQRDMIRQAAERFVEENHNLKAIFQALVVSPFYRADGLAEGEIDEARLAELDDIGVVRMLGPEQLERKIVAIFGRPWGRLDETYAILYGGIDSKEVTERLTSPSGAVGALQRIMANDVACKNVAADFKLPPQERRLFPTIEPTVTPLAADAAAERQIRDAIVHLHRHILGREDQPADPEVDQTYQLFSDVVREATAREQFEKTESYFCKSAAQEGPRDPDPLYTIRGWRAVVTYLLRQQDFLYE